MNNSIDYKRYTMFQIPIEHICDMSYYNPETKEKFKILDSEYYKSFYTSDLEVPFDKDDMKKTDMFNIVFKTKANF